eukprot:11814-Rhodomonas_salina.2
MQTKCEITQKPNARSHTNRMRGQMQAKRTNPHPHEKSCGNGALKGVGLAVCAFAERHARCWRKEFKENKRRPVCRGHALCGSTIVLRIRYEMSGTDMRYAATRKEGRRAYGARKRKNDGEGEGGTMGGGASGFKPPVSVPASCGLKVSDECVVCRGEEGCGGPEARWGEA